MRIIEYDKGSGIHPKDVSKHVDVTRIQTIIV